MAKPTGAVTAGEYTLTAGRLMEGDAFYYFVIHLPRMPKDLCDDEEDGHFSKIEISPRVYHEDLSESGDTLGLVWRFCGSITEMGQGYDDPIDPMAYQTAELFDHYPTTTNINFEAPYKQSFVVLEVRITRDSSTNALREISFVNFETVFDSDVDADQAQITNRSSSSQRLYKPDMFLSAWHMRSILADTLAMMLQEARPVFSTPLCGNYYGDPV